MLRLNSSRNRTVLSNAQQTSPRSLNFDYGTFKKTLSLTMLLRSPRYFLRSTSFFASVPQLRCASFYHASSFFQYTQEPPQANEEKEKSSTSMQQNARAYTGKADWNSIVPVEAFESFEEQEEEEDCSDVPIEQHSEGSYHHVLYVSFLIYFILFLTFFFL